MRVLASHNHVLAYRRTASQARRVAALAELDGLTGCLNNRAFHERLARGVRAASGSTPVSLVILDIDHFKDVNDQHGHPAGDAVLEGVGRGPAEGVPGRRRRRPAAAATSSPCSCRTRRRPRRSSVAERVRAEVGRIEAEHAITVSVGRGHQRPADGRQPVLAAADRAVYAAKRAGRDRVAEREPEAA